jgi:DNA-binding MarR family transcriptional regulator
MSAHRYKHPGPHAAPQKRTVEPPPIFRINFLIHDVSRMRRTVFDQAVKPLGVTRSQWWALVNLARLEPEGAIQTDLARVLDIGKVTMGGLIDRLEASGHVERRPDPQDRRVNRIYITDKGHGLIEKMQEISRDLNSVIYAGIPLEKIFLVEDVMGLIKANLRKRLEAGSDIPDEAEFDEPAVPKAAARRSA